MGTLVAIIKNHQNNLSLPCGPCFCPNKHGYTSEAQSAANSLRLHGTKSHGQSHVYLRTFPSLLEQSSAKKKANMMQSVKLSN